MKYRRLGRSGLKISEFSLGSWVSFAKQMDTRAAVELMACAYDTGVNFFDNAEGYESGNSEIVMGEALKQLNWGRDSFCVSSKVFWGGDKPTQKGLSAKHVYDACHAALKRLQLDYLDLFYCHRPDVDTPIEETVRAMHNLITQGKIIYWGTSEWSAQQIMEAYSVARQYNLTPPTMEQPHYNMFERERVEKEFYRLYDEVGLGTTTFSPLASGVLTGKYAKGIPDNSRLSLPGYEWLKAFYESEEGRKRMVKSIELNSLADSIGIPLSHLALGFCLNNKNVSSVILGASTLSQLKNNLQVFENLDKISPDNWLEVEKVLANKPELPEKF